jgi:GxxExxY protein
MQDKERLDRITETIIGVAIDVHRALGPGLLETVYEACLSFDLTERGLSVERQRVVPLSYKGVRLECGYRVDLVIDNAVIVEVKAVEQLLPVHAAQLLSYLRLANLPVGLLINFDVTALQRGIRRIVNSYPDSLRPLRSSATSAWKGPAS